MNAPSKKVLATAFAALVALTLPTGCGYEAIPGVIGGTVVGPVGGAGGAGAAGGAFGTNGGLVRGNVPAGAPAGAGGVLPQLP
ncbi:hypothetical protein [Mycobacterium shigaense]|uniref:Uncharacterized protein n=1 Tax=Mycobacterium shigaense TaxID=722731 RepID=A0A1Z4EFA1_9MYCO|nr:hypothetical protein [Mycobacterium shigaense]MEA1122191.1 hypothetical protein [Mycobacterium shigaense]PRI16375.1 hypothetical protein B2J96_06215 [Mycobacterium shigaense]BAX91636.1 hypothetical protein MSG_01480 [Mycobacterium shigaense]